MHLAVSNKTWPAGLQEPNAGPWRKPLAATEVIPRREAAVWGEEALFWYAPWPEQASEKGRYLHGVIVHPRLQRLLTLTMNEVLPIGLV